MDFFSIDLLLPSSLSPQFLLDFKKKLFSLETNLLNLQFFCLWFSLSNFTYWFVSILLTLVLEILLIFKQIDSFFETDCLIFNYSLLDEKFISFFESNLPKTQLIYRNKTQFDLVLICQKTSLILLQSIFLNTNCWFSDFIKSNEK